jgi:hypothetical protein
MDFNLLLNNGIMLGHDLKQGIVPQVMGEKADRLMRLYPKASTWIRVANIISTLNDTP